MRIVTVWNHTPMATTNICKIILKVTPLDMHPHKTLYICNMNHYCGLRGFHRKIRLLHSHPKIILFVEILYSFTMNKMHNFITVTAWQWPLLKLKPSIMLVMQKLFHISCKTVHCMCIVYLHLCGRIKETCRLIAELPRLDITITLICIISLSL